MSLKIITIIGLLGLAASMSFLGETSKREIRKNKFGATEIIDYHDNGSKKQVFRPINSFMKDYAQQAQFIIEAQEQIEINQEKLASGKIYECDNRIHGGGDSPGFFIPVYVGEVGEKQGGDITYTQGRCFENIKFSVAPEDPNNPDDLTLIVTTSDPKSILCMDWFFFGSISLYHVDSFFFSGDHEIVFKNLDSDEKIDIIQNGIQIYMFCDGYIETFVSVWKTLKCFIGGTSPDPKDPIWGSHVPQYMEEVNVEFLNKSMGYNLVEREIQVVEINPDLIQSGDLFSITRLDGIDPLIMYGSGAHSGHSTMALRFDGELYIVESQDGWYWPRHGIQRNKWSDWIRWANDASFHLNHMPLKEEVRNRFNETSAQQYFFQTEGLPYGYHNFLFGWIDTPELNWPPLLPVKLLPIVFSILEKIDPDTTNNFLGQALNKRLGTQGLNLPELAVEAAKKNLTLEDVIAMPEEDKWVYDDGLSMVCSAYVAALYKAAGLFGDLDVQATEMTPRDVYTLNFFDTNWQRPESCVKADPDQPFCQLLGKYRQTFPGYSTVEPYNGMDEHCPTVAPLYLRPTNC